MSWTTPADLRAQVQKLWDKGELLRPCVQGYALFPRRLRLTGPTSTELTERFDEARIYLESAASLMGPWTLVPSITPIGASVRWEDSFATPPNTRFYRRRTTKL